jgi:hypothetical protein
MGRTRRILNPSNRLCRCDAILMKRTAPRWLRAALLLSAGALLASCKPQPPPTSPPVPESAAVHASLDHFKGQPTEENLARVEADLAKMKAAIAGLDGQVDNASGAEKSESQAKLDELRVQYARYQADFAAARAAATMNKAGDAAEQAAEKAGEAAREAVQAVENTFTTEKEKP